MEDAKLMAQQQQQMMQQQQQQLLLLQQIQRQKQQHQQDAMSRFPSNIDVHLRPQQHMRLQQSTNSSQPQSSSQNPSSSNFHPQLPNQLQSQSSNPNAMNNAAISNNSSNSQQQQQQQQHKASLQMAYQDAWRVCHPEFKRPFSSLEDACERLLPYHVVADYEAEEDDRILESDTTGQVLSRSQQWDHNIAAKVAEFTATFEKQVLAFNIINRKRGLGEFRTEEKLMMEQLLLQDEKRQLLEFRAQMDSRQKASRENHEASMRMAAMERARVDSRGHADKAMQGPIRASSLGSQGNHEAGEQSANHDEMINGWDSNAQRDDKDPSADFLNDEETENGDTAMQSEWHGSGEFDLNAR